MNSRREFPIALQALCWAAGNSIAGAVIGLAVGFFREEKLEMPIVLISVLFANVVGFTVLIASLVLFPRLRRLRPVLGSVLLMLALGSGSLAGTIAVLLFFPLFVARDLTQALAVAAINALTALLVGGVFYVYEGLRLRLAESLREVEEVRLVEARLQEEAARAELSALQARINPHFFFNTLNTISSLVEDDPRHAGEVVQTLSDLFRYTLKASDATPVPLSEELDFVRDYLTIEQARFGERLRVRWQLAPDSLEIPVPGLILQPLVENAVGHGLAPRSSGGTVTISAMRHEARLELQVNDDGVGLPAAGAGGFPSGHGLGNVMRRLDAFYGGVATLELVPAAGGGTLARLELPITPDRGTSAPRQASSTAAAEVSR